MELRSLSPSINKWHWNKSKNYSFKQEPSLTYNKISSLQAASSTLLKPSSKEQTSLLTQISMEERKKRRRKSTPPKRKENISTKKKRCTLLSSMAFKKTQLHTSEKHAQPADLVSLWPNIGTDIIADSATPQWRWMPRQLNKTKRLFERREKNLKPKEN